MMSYVIPTGCYVHPARWDGYNWSLSSFHCAMDDPENQDECSGYFPGKGVRCVHNPDDTDTCLLAEPYKRGNTKRKAR